VLTAFLSYKYDVPEIFGLATDIAVLLQTLEVRLLDGKQLNATRGLNGQVIERIESAQLIIALVYSQHPSEYVSQEIGFAVGKQIPIVVISDNADAKRALAGDQYFILVGRGGFNIAADLVRAINAIKAKRSLSVEPTLSQHSAKSEIEAEGWTSDVRDRLTLIRAAFDSQSFSDALAVASDVATSHPDCWRSFVAKSAALVHLHEFDEAARILEDARIRFSSNTRALGHIFQNLGWILERRSVNRNPEALQHRIDYYKLSVSNEPRLAVYVNLIQSLLEADRLADAEIELANCLSRFPDAAAQFRKQVEVIGSELVRQITKSRILSAIVFPPTQYTKE